MSLYIILWTISFMSSNVACLVKFGFKHPTTCVAKKLVVYRRVERLRFSVAYLMFLVSIQRRLATQAMLSVGFIKHNLYKPLKKLARTDSKIFNILTRKKTSYTYLQVQKSQQFNLISKERVPLKFLSFIASDFALINKKLNIGSKRYLRVINLIYCDALSMHRL